MLSPPVPANQPNSLQIWALSIYNQVKLSTSVIAFQEYLYGIIARSTSFRRWKGNLIRLSVVAIVHSINLAPCVNSLNLCVS